MIQLYTTYFKHISEIRQKELDFCLINNFLNANIDKIYIFLDDKTTCEDVLSTLKKSEILPTSKLEFIKINHIPTFKDWIQFSETKDEDISIFTNADIHLDETILKIEEYIKTEKSIICLSRHDEIEDKIVPHANPEWSQDLWALKGKNIKLINFESELEISTGKCRCDNKLAYVFAVRGWDIYNPCRDITCIHKHNSKIRDYNKLDTCVVGALAFVDPTISGLPSSLEITIMPINNKNIKKVSLNSWLCRNQVE